MATDLYQVLETSDVPPGVVNIVSGNALELGTIWQSTMMSWDCGWLEVWMNVLMLKNTVPET